MRRMAVWLTPFIKHYTRLPVQRVYLQQLYFSGVQSFWVSVIAGGALGAVIVSLVQGNFGQSSDTAMSILLVVVLKEVAPLMIGLLFSARSASALASEMATMAVSGEIQTLALLRISALEYLMWPRVIAAALSCALLYIYFSAAAVIAGMLTITQSDLGAQWRAIAQHTDVILLVAGVLKTFLFGALIAWIAATTGLQARSGLTEIPRLASRAVLHAVIAVFVVDAVILLVS